MSLSLIIRKSQLIQTNARREFVVSNETILKSSLLGCGQFTEQKAADGVVGKDS